MQHIVIFGATSAIATACARRWAAQGASLFLVGRDTAKLDILLADIRARARKGQTVVAASADLNDYNRQAELLAQAEKEIGGMDIALIAHGSLPDQKACEQSVELTMREIGTNALSLIALSTVIANKMEMQSRGTLAVIGSVAGDRGRQSNYIYGSAKGMISIFLAGLRNRLVNKGVSVVTIKPGFVDTPMTAGHYKKGPLWAQPDTIAEGILNAIDKKRDIVYLPWFWRYIMMIICHIPEVIFKKLSL